MKIIAYITALFLLAFAFQPMLGALMHHHSAALEISHHCCEHAADNCCDNDAGEQNRQCGQEMDCGMQCHCTMHSSAAFDVSSAPSLRVFEQAIVKIETYTSTYKHSHLNHIWHPPQA